MTESRIVETEVMKLAAPASMYCMYSYHISFILPAARMLPQGLRDKSMDGLIRDCLK